MASSMMNWINEWNDIIRQVIFKDEDLKALMLLPENTTIIEFIDRYFIRAGYTNKLLSDEKVRIIYSDLQGSDSHVPNVKRKMITFDIFVKNEYAHNVSTDRLVMRTQMIANKLIELLTKDRYLNNSGYRFWISGDWDLGTRTSGYTRYCVAFNYMKVY